MCNKYDNYYKQIGLNIKLYRGYKDYSQEELAEKAGISVVYLSKVENGNCNPSLNVLFNISEALEVSVNKLFEFRG